MVQFEGWLPEEILTMSVNGEAVSEFTTDAEGNGRYIFPSPAELVSVEAKRANGDIVVTGQADCTQPPPEIKYMEAEPFDPSVPLGGTVQFTAKTVDDDDNPVEVPTIWTADSGSITSEGLFTPAVEGITIVTLSLIGDRMASSNLIEVIVTPPLSAISIEQLEVSLVVGDVFRFSAVGVDDEGNEVDITPIWSADGGNMSADGFFEATEAGEYTITANVPGIDLTASTNVLVKPEVDHVDIQPKIEELEVGDMQQFEVLAYDADGNEMELPGDVFWFADIGVIDNKGQYVATIEGEETITVTVSPAPILGGKSGGGILAKEKIFLFGNLMFHVRPKTIEEIIKSEPIDEDQVPMTAEERNWWNDCIRRKELVGSGLIAMIGIGTFSFSRKINSKVPIWILMSFIGIAALVIFILLAIIF